MGDLGACPASVDGDFGQVTEYLAAQGYEANLYDRIGMDGPMDFELVDEPTGLCKS